MPDFPDTIEVEEESINPNTGLSDEVSLVIDDTPFKFWETVEIKLSLDNLADTFSLSGPFDFENPDFLEIYKPYTDKEVALYAAGEKILTGRMIRPSTDNSSNSSRITVQGYSNPGLIANVNTAPTNWPIMINGLDLKEIAEKLVSPFEIDIVFDNVEPGAKFTKADKVRLEPDGKIGDFLITLAKQRGLILSADSEGQLVFHKVTSERAEVSIIAGEWPWISSGASYDGQNMFSDITAIGTNNKKGAGGSSTVNNPALSSASIPRHQVFKASDIAQGGLKDAANATLGRMLADSVKVSLSCVGWHRPDDKLWKDNQKIVFVSARDLLIEEDEYITRNVTLKKNPSSATVDIDLVFPEAYNGQIKSSFPWE
jgi:prophage tail gpP-like protein